MTDKLPLKDRVKAHREAHPEASIPAIAGALGEPPQAIAEVLNEDTPETEQDISTRTRDRVQGSRERSRTDLDPGSWKLFSDAEFTDPESGVFPPALLEREQWMGHQEKKPFAPWSTRTPPVECSNDNCPADHADDEDCECDGRYKWGHEGHYVDGDTIAMAEVDPQLGGRAFIQTDDDPFVYVDGDDVRDPETGDVHPAFIAMLEHLGPTYVDISTSGAGSHAIYRGELPDGVKQGSWRLDEKPWGSNEDLPSIEIYPGKRVNVMTGDHVPGTPVEVQEWNVDILDPLLEANNEVATANRTDRNDVSTDPSDYDFENHDPDATSSDETTTDIRDIFHALDRLDAQRVAGKTIVRSWNDSASTSDGERAFWPTWGSVATDSGTANIVNDKRWQDTGDLGGYGGPVVMALIDAGEMQPTRASPRRASGELWWTGIEHLRDLGFDIPQLEPDGVDAGTDHDVVLPETPALESATSGWDWRNASEDSTLSIDEARERTKDAIAGAYESSDRRLIEALPTMGKSFGAIAAAAESGEQITVLTGRGREEQYEQFQNWCDEHGLSYYTLPAFTRDCDTANGEHGEGWAETVRDWYLRGATPEMIHKSADYHLGEPLPCQAGDHSCPYSLKWDFDPDDYDVLIGHYTHAYKSTVTSGRTVVVDEFPSAYETSFGPMLKGAVSYWLSTTEEIPYEDWTDLVENRRDQSRRGEALLWFEDNEIEPDETLVFEDASAHAYAPLAVYALLAGEDLGNGFEQASLTGVGTAVYNRETTELWILQTPELTYASGVVALDGTPTKRMWELALGSRLNKRAVLQEGERASYIEQALNLNLIQTTDAVKPYNSADYVNIQQDAALLEGIADQHGQRPSVISSITALEEFDDTGVLDKFVDETKHYGNVLGSNEFKTSRLGAVIGSNHYGDGFIKKWGAYAGEAVERNDGKGSDLSYGEFGDRILSHMREHDTLQAAMRFGRDGNGAVVYVHTDTLPDWVPLAGEGRVVTTWSDGMRDVLDVIRTEREWTTAEIAAHPDVDIGERQVRKHLTSLYEQGVLDREVEGCGFIWTDGGLHRVGEHGEVELEDVDVDELIDAGSAELARTVIYTWEFRRSPSESPGPASDAARDGRGGSSGGFDGGDRPPDGGVTQR